MIICTCGVAWLGIVYVECVYWISVYIVSMTVCQGMERRRLHPPQTVFYCVCGCHVSAPYSCVSYKYEAQLCISVNIFFSFNFLMQKNLLFIASI